MIILIIDLWDFFDMNVLSLFNGLSFGKMALDELNIKVDKYYSSEIDKYAIQATQAIFPDTIQLGDVTKWREWDIDFSGVDLLLAGFPCQAWSMAGKQKGDNDPRGALVHDLIDIWNEIKLKNPNMKFMFENVKMKKEFLDYINKLFGVEPVCINSALVSAQNRVRYYWTNIPGDSCDDLFSSGAIAQPEDESIMLKDILEFDGNFTFMSDKFVDRQKGRKCLRDNLDGKAVNLSAMEYVKNGRQGDYIKCGAMRGRYLVDGKRADNQVGSQKGITTQRLELREDDKTNCLTTVQKDNYVVINSSQGKNPILTKGYVQFDPNNKGNKSQCNRVNLPDSKHKALSGTSGGNKHGVVTKIDIREKSKCVRSSGRGSIDRHEWDSISDCHYRKLTPRECMRLQTVPEHHIDTLLDAGISNTQLYKMTGNGWTHKVIVHIFKGLNE